MRGSDLNFRRSILVALDIDVWETRIEPDQAVWRLLLVYHLSSNKDKKNVLI